MPYRLLWFLCGPLLAAWALAAPQPGQKVPTTEQIYASFENADYPKVLRQIAAVLALKGDAAAAYDRHELLALKAEALVRQKSFREAADAFDAASRATIVETKAAVDRSTAELLRRSKSGLYTPAAGKGAAATTPIDVTDPSNRSDAFVLLFEESVVKVEPAIKAAQKSGKLPAMVDAFRMLNDLRTLELAATAGDAKSVALAQPLTAKARAMMARAVTEMSGATARMQDPANQEYKVGPGGELLRRDYGGDLLDISAECDRITRLASDLLTAFAGDEADALRTLRDDAAELGLRTRMAGDVAWRDDGWAEGPTAGQMPAANVGPEDGVRGGKNPVRRPDRGQRPAGTAGNRGAGR